MLNPGTLFDERYLIDTFIGVGGQAQVYKATDQHLRREVALKLMRPEDAITREELQRFRREAKIISRLDHRFILRCYHMGFANGTMYACLEYVQAPDLAQTIASASLDWSRALEICAQVCQALQYAHNQGVLHRDLTPRNILVFKDTVKIIDFGLAASRTLVEEQKLTLTGEILGTPFFISPEQWLGKTADERSDIYSLGCVLYQCLTGELPFYASNSVTLAVSHTSATPPPLNLTGVPDETVRSLDAIIRKALAKDRNNRYQTTGELLADLQAVQQGRKPLAAVAMVTRTTPKIIFASFTVAALLLALALVSSHMPRQPQESDTGESMRITGDAIADALTYSKSSLRARNHGNIKDCTELASKSLELLSTALGKDSSSNELDQASRILTILQQCRLRSGHCIEQILPLARIDRLTKPALDLTMQIVGNEREPVENLGAQFVSIADAFANNKETTARLYDTYKRAVINITPTDSRYGGVTATRADLARISGAQSEAKETYSLLNPSSKYAALYPQYIQVAQYRLGQAALSANKFADAAMHFKMADNPILVRDQQITHTALIRVYLAQSLALSGRIEEADSILQRILSGSTATIQERKLATLELAANGNIGPELLRREFQNDHEALFINVHNNIQEEFRASRYRRTVSLAKVIASLPANSKITEEMQIHERIYQGQALMQLHDVTAGTRVARELIHDLMTGYKHVSSDFRQERLRVTWGLIGGMPRSPTQENSVTQ